MTSAAAGRSARFPSLDRGNWPLVVGFAVPAIPTAFRRRAGVPIRPSLGRALVRRNVGLRQLACGD
jgi:hypothetical protein